MKFLFKDVEINTEKPIYVCGHSYAKSWFAYCFDNMYRGRDGEESVKQLYVSKIFFQYDVKNEENVIQRISLMSKNNKFYVNDLGICAFGRTPNEARKMLEIKSKEYQKG